MKSIRFGRASMGSTTVQKKTVPPSMKEPVAKRIFQLVFVLALIVFGGYWFFSSVAFRSYEGIVVGDQTTLTSFDAGVVDKLYVDAHYPFLANTELMKIENPDLRLKIQTLEKEIELTENAKKAYELQDQEELRVKRAVAQASLQAAESSKKAVEEQLKSAEDLLSRVENLRAQNAVTQATVDQKAQSVRTARADLASANQKWIESKLVLDATTMALENVLQMGSRQGQEQEKDLLTKKAILQELRERESRLLVRGVRPGIVTHLQKLPGDVVRAGDPLVQVLYEGDVWIDAYIDPRDRLEVVPGLEVTIKAAKSPLRKPVRGVVISLSPVTHAIPDVYRDIHESPDQFVVARVRVDVQEILKAGFSPGQVVRVQSPRW